MLSVVRKHHEDKNWDRHYLGRWKNVTCLQVSIECPLILLVKLKWRQSRALGSEEANVMRKCFVVSLHWREVKVKVKCTPYTGTEALYRPYGP